MSANKSYNNSGGWLVLAVFTAVAGVSQMLWLNFAPLISMLQQRYQINELEASMLILVFPALYVLLSLHAGAIIDRRGYQYTVGRAAILMAVGACIRIYDVSFYALLFGQVAIAAAQPYVVNAISKLVADWFEEESHGLATGIGTIGMFAGMALALALTPTLVAHFDLRGAMVVFAGVSIAAAAAFLSLARENPHTGNLQVTAARPLALRILLRDRNLSVLFLISLLALGFFNGLTTWLEPILAERGIDAQTAGLVGGTLIVGGILGSALIPFLSDRTRRRKPFLILCGVTSLALVYPLCTATNMDWLLVLGALTGFFFLPGYALLFAMTEEHAGSASAGAAAGLLMLAGNAGGVIVVVAMELVHGATGSWMSAIYLMLVLIALTTLLAFGSRESLGSRKGGMHRV